MWPFAKWMEQLFRLLKPGDPYYRQWVRFRRGLIFRTVGGCLSMPIVLISLGMATYFLPKEYGWYVAGIVFVIAVMLLSSLYRPLCPRCRQLFIGPFQKSWIMAQMIQERCPHCDLQLYAPHGEL